VKKEFFTVVILTVFLFTGCEQKAVDQQASEVKNQEVRVSTVIAQKKSYSPELSFGGTFKPFKEANLSAHMPGRIKKIYYREGSRVQKDALIVTLSDEMTKAVKAELDAIEKDYSRVSDLVEKKIVPAQQLDHLQAQLDATKAKYEMMISNMEIRAPFNGVVAEHMMKEGEEFILLNPGFTPGFSHSSGIIRFMDIDKLLIEIEVGEKDYSGIKKMKTIDVTAEAYPDKILKGQLFSEESLVSTLSRTVKISIAVDNSKHLIKPGMFGRVNIKLPATESVVVPRIAVDRQAGSDIHYVFTEKGGVVTRKGVEIVDDLGDVLAVSGLNGDEKVVTAGKTKLRSGMTVVTVNQ